MHWTDKKVTDIISDNTWDKTAVSLQIKPKPV